MSACSFGRVKLGGEGHLAYVLAEMFERVRERPGGSDVVRAITSGAFGGAWAHVRLARDAPVLDARVIEQRLAVRARLIDDRDQVRRALGRRREL